MHLLTICALLAFAAPFGGDVLPPGHKPVRHELTVEVAPDALTGRKLWVHPTGGLYGIAEVLPGDPFRFSGKYGTALYSAPADFEPKPEHFDRRTGLNPALVKITIPIDDRSTLPLTDRTERILTRLRLTPSAAGSPVLVVADETSYDARGAVIGAGLASIGVASDSVLRRIAADGRILTLLTILIETAIVLLLVPADRRPRVAVVAVLANAVTHTVALAAMAALPAGWSSWFAVEAGVTLIELLAYRFGAKLAWTRAALLAVLANAVTASIGVLIG